MQPNRKHGYGVANMIKYSRLPRGNRILRNQYSFQGMRPEGTKRHA